MTADQIAGCVAIVAMMSLVVSRLANDPTPRHKMLRMAAIWVGIVVVIVAVVMALKPSS